MTSCCSSVTPQVQSCYSVWEVLAASPSPGRVQSYYGLVVLTQTITSCCCSFSSLGHWAVNATLSHVSQNIIFDMKASPGLSPQTAAIARHPRNHAPLTLLYTCISRSISLLPWEQDPGSKTVTPLKCIKACSPIKTYSSFPQKMALGFTKSEPLSTLNILMSVKKATGAHHCSAHVFPS